MHHSLNCVARTELRKVFVINVLFLLFCHILSLGCNLHRNPTMSQFTSGDVRKDSGDNNIESNRKAFCIFEKIK